ncbi:hypothetical protein ACKKBG_A06140 [Auxenochlorella protothecoides x Auxenochlorella symbiontica]
MASLLDESALADAGSMVFMHEMGSAASEETTPRPLTSSEKAKARNRRAQATYRAKRRMAKVQIKNTFAQLNSELEEARQEHEMLRVRDDIFNRALYVRNQCIDILQAAAETSGIPSMPSNIREPGLTAGQLGLLYSSGWELDRKADELLLHGSELLAFQSASVEQLGDVWVRTCRGLREDTRRAVQLQDSGVRDEALLQRIQEVFARGRLRLWHLCRHRPGCVAEVIRGGRTPASNSFAPERWLAVLDAVRLTPEQEAILDRVQTVALSHLDRVMEQRKRLLDAVAHLRERRPSGLGQLDLTLSLNLHSVVERLQENLEEERRITTVPCKALFSNDFTHLQRAIIFSESAPTLPDFLW